MASEYDLRVALLGLVSNFCMEGVSFLSPLSGWTPNFMSVGICWGACSAVKLYLGVVWLGCREGTGKLEEREWGFPEKLAGGGVGGRC